MNSKKLTAIMLPMLALSACADFPEEDLREELYTRAFIKEFGLIDPGHTWGFQPAGARSRAVDVNGNEWIQPPEVTEYEKNFIMNYLKGTDIITVDAIPYTDYFVTQVSGSHEEYTALNGTTVYDGSENMDHLQIAEKAGWSMADLAGSIGGETSSDNWAHCNNFNASSNTNYGGNTVMYDSGTYHFAYYNSADASFHDKYIVVPGTVIGPAYSSYYYVCFDFDAHEGTYTQYRANYTFYPTSTDLITFEGEYSPGNDPTEAQFEAKIREILNARLWYAPESPVTDISWEYVEQADGSTTYRVTYSYTQTVSGEILEFDGVYHNAEYGNESDPTEAEITAKIEEKLLADYGYSGAIEGLTYSFSSYQQANKYVLGNNIYDDWVVRICGPAIKKGDGVPTYPTTLDEDGTPVVPTPSEDVEWMRIMVEDLSVRAANNLEISSSDWDFNDLVFDTYFDDDHQPHVKVRALGGIYPIYICDQNGVCTDELHSLFGCATTTMINTGGVQREPIDITAHIAGKNMDFGSTNIYDIRVMVDLGGGKQEMSLTELTAPEGLAPSKICVPQTVDWPRERQHITERYPGFRDWVADQDNHFW